MVKEYALYKGEKLIGIGTIKELAKMENVKPSTIYWYSTPSNVNRDKGKRKILIKL